MRLGEAGRAWLGAGVAGRRRGAGGERAAHEDEARVGRIGLEGEGVEHGLLRGGRATLHVAHLTLEVVQDVHEAEVERLEVCDLEEARLLRLVSRQLRGGERLMPRSAIVHDGVAACGYVAHGVMHTTMQCTV